MKKIDINTWERKSVYNYFKTFSNPCYGFDVEMDITKLYNFTKMNNQKFFINMLYLVTIGLNDIEEFRERIVHDEVVVYDEINPTYTVMKDNGFFENGRHIYTRDYQEFYKRCLIELEECKTKKKISDDYNDADTYNDFYITCIPWLKYESMSNPLPDNDHSNSSVPRVCWSKFYTVNDKVKIKLNITVSHCLVDGYHLSNAFNHIQELFDNADAYLK